MNSNRIWALGSLVIIVAVLAGGYFLGVSPKLAAAAAADASREEIDQQNASYEQELAQLKTEYADIDARRADLASARVSVPSEAEDAEFVGELHALQESSGATVKGFTVSDPKGYMPVVTEAPVAPAPEGEQTAETAADTSTPDSTITADTTPAAVSTPAVPGAELMTPETFVAIPYSISISGTLEQTEAYVAQLQSATRLFLVTKLTFAYDETAGAFNASIEGYTWVYRPGAAVEESPVATGATAGAVAQ